MCSSVFARFLQRFFSKRVVPRELCCEREPREVWVRIHRKYKNTRSGYRDCYDVYEQHRCSRCGRLLSSVKVRSDLTYTQAALFVSHHYGEELEGF